MRVAKSGRAQTRRELVVQVIAGMTTTIEISAPVMSQTPAEERQLGQGGLLAEQLDEVVSLEPTDCGNNEFVKINEFDGFRKSSGAKFGDPNSNRSYLEIDASSGANSFEIGKRRPRAF